jgi:hypothetical protein
MVKSHHYVPWDEAENIRGKLFKLDISGKFTQSERGTAGISRINESGVGDFNLNHVRKECELRSQTKTTEVLRAKSAKECSYL